MFVLEQIPLSLPIPSEAILIQIMIIKKTRRFDVIIMLLLHVIHTSVGGGIEPFTHHMMNVSARIPVTLITVVSTKDDEEGHGRDEDSDTVGVCDVAYFIPFLANFVICFEEVVHSYRYETW